MKSSVSRSAKTWPRPDGRSLGGGAVQVSVLVPVSVEEAWSALTERDVVARWFGDLSDTLKQDSSHRLDFGDGDFFALSGVTLDPPRRITYSWRFLSTGPVDAISWSIDPQGTNCLVTVMDAEPSRTAAGCREMIEGWTDFLQRLQDYCVTGQNSRYAWRSEFSGSIELPIDAERAFTELVSPEGQRRWLPWSAEALASGTVITVADEQEPLRLTIGSVKKTGDSAFRFTLTCPDWQAETECQLDVQPWRQGALLVVQHIGWPKIDPRDSEQAAQRTRFGTLWIKSLKAAQELLAR
jgi:uncharacterized protein YndB with AHSA1/START domain